MKGKKREESVNRYLPTAEVAWLKDEIDAYERIFDKFLRRGRKILKKYRDVRTPREDAITRYNILWANVQTRLPALYARNPKAVVERRYKDRDPIGRTAAEVLERSIEYSLEHCNDLMYTMRHVVRDYELPGRGTIWVRYEPHFHKAELPAAQELGITINPQTSETLAEGSSITSNAEDEVAEETLAYEETLIDYVSWEDFGHSWGRTWDEVRLIWRRVYLDREELQERFTNLNEAQILQIPMDFSPKNLTDTQIRITRKKAIVYEIMDKHSRMRYWLVKNFPVLLDKREDELGLAKFFPCPRPLIANELSDELLPTPNFTFYQDQANEIDELSTRIGAITKALKVCGVYDASVEGLDRMLSEGIENQLIPIKGWQALKEKGGLTGVMQLIPLKEIAETLGYLREQRQQLIEDVYQITGIADIVRGFSDPNETATAQQMKGQFSMIRLEDAQREVQRFCRDIVHIVGEIVSDYDIETLKAISGVKLLTAIEKQQLQAQIALQQMAAAQTQGTPLAIQGGTNPMASPQGAIGGGIPRGMPATGAFPTQVGIPPTGNPNASQPSGMMHPGMPASSGTPAPGQAPISPDRLKLLELPTWEEIEALLQNPVYREFRLDIETDSTIRMDEETEKAARIELITKVGEFLDKAIQAGQGAPEIVPMLGELLMFAVRAFKAGRPIEQALDDAMSALSKAAQQPRPNPEMQAAQIKAQTDIQIANHKAQLDAQVAQAQQQAQAQQNQQAQQLEATREQHKAQLDAQLESHKAQLDATTQQAVQHMKNQFEAERAQFEGAIKLRVAQIETNARLREKQMQLSHDAAESHRQRQHEKSLPKPKAA